MKRHDINIETLTTRYIGGVWGKPSGTEIFMSDYEYSVSGKVYLGLRLSEKKPFTNYDIRIEYFYKYARHEQFLSDIDALKTKFESLGVSVQDQTSKTKWMCKQCGVYLSTALAFKGKIWYNYDADYYCEQCHKYWQAHMEREKLREARAKIQKIKQVRAASGRKSVYVLRAYDCYKIGIANSVEDRINTLQTGCPEKIEHVFSKEVNNAKLLEKTIHADFKNFRKNGEWFNLSPDQLQTISSLICQWN